MAWPVDAPIYNFNHFSVAVNAPAQSGVYALFDNDRQLMFVDTGEIQCDLLRLAEDGDADLAETGPTYFSFLLAPLEQCESWKRRLAMDSFASGVPVFSTAKWSAPRT